MGEGTGRDLLAQKRAASEGSHGPRSLTAPSQRCMSFEFALAVEQHAPCERESRGVGWTLQSTSCIVGSVVVVIRIMSLLLPGPDSLSPLQFRACCCEGSALTPFPIMMTLIRLDCVGLARGQLCIKCGLSNVPAKVV